MRYADYKHKYQDFATRHIIENKACGLFIDMGLGKTAATCTAVDQLMYEDFEIEKVLVIAPKTVALNTWPAEVKKWDHLNHLKLSVIDGSATKRVAALNVKADIYLIARDNVAWLVTHYGTAFPYDMVIIDESSSFKDQDTKRFRALKGIRPKVKRMVLLTGTPAPESLMDLWSQLYLLDKGERLGTTLTGYREAYFIQKHNGRGYKVRPQSVKEIYDRISDVCISMKTEDYLTLPGRIEHVINLQFDQALQDKYDDFEEEQIMKMFVAPQTGEPVEITAVNAGVLVNKLLQFANGAVYDIDRNVHHIHDLKLDALGELIEAAQGQPVIVFYQYIHDRDRILKKFSGRLLTGPKDVDDWNAGKIPLFVLHAASAGHGLNLQDGGHIVIWFGLTHSAEKYQQANKRVDRQGQKKITMIYKIVCSDTWDFKVMDNLARKADGQNELMEAVKARIAQYRKKVINS